MKKTTKYTMKDLDEAFRCLQKDVESDGDKTTLSYAFMVFKIALKSDLDDKDEFTLGDITDSAMEIVTDLYAMDDSTDPSVRMSAAAMMTTFGYGVTRYLTGDKEDPEPEEETKEDPEDKKEDKKSAVAAALHTLMNDLDIPVYLVIK